MGVFSNIGFAGMLSAFWTFLGIAFKGVLVLGIGYLLTRWLLSLTGKGLKRSKINSALHTFILSAIKILCYVFIFIIVLTILNIPTTSLITAIGTAGVAVGLALKNSLSNFASGVIILANAPFSDGDVVEIGGKTGVVTGIGLMSTTIKTLDNSHVIIPNNTVTNGVVTNFTAEKQRRLDMTFAIGYQDDADVAIQLIKDVLASKGESVLKQPQEPFVKVVDYAGGTAKIGMRIWCKVDDIEQMQHSLLRDVKTAFDANNIGMK